MREKNDECIFLHVKINVLNGNKFFFFCLNELNFSVNNIVKSLFFI